MKTTKMTTFFDLIFLFYLLVTFISDGPFWSVKYLNFCQKLLIWTAHHTFPESRHPQVTKNLYYVLFTRRANTHFFRLQLMDYIGG